MEAKDARAAARPEERARDGASVHDSVERRLGATARVALPDAASAAGSAAPGAEIVPAKRGDYRVLGEIARGGMGRILRAHDPDLGRDVAIKVLDPRFAERADVLRRFVEEAQIGGQLQHPGVVPVYELGLLADERPYFAMKLVKGRTLAELLAGRREPSENSGLLLRVFESVCQTVAYAHSKGVIHRDLKPANVMVGAFGEVQVVDWGLSKVLRRAGAAPASTPRDARSTIETVRSATSDSAADSLVGSVLGTPAYMPPEQARGEVDSLDERSDVFALGAILCEILTGLPPYVEREGESLLQQAAQAKLGDAVARLETCGGEPELIELARTSLAPAPGARLQNGAAVANAMQVHLASAAERAREAELEAADQRGRARAEGKARRLTVALSALGAVATFAVAGSWIWRERHAAAEFVRVERALTDIQARAEALEEERGAEEALDTARSALLLVQDRPEGDALRARAEGFVAQTEAQARSTRERREREQRDAALLLRLDELRTEASVDMLPEEHVPLDAQFEQAFADWGLEVERDLLASLERLRASGLGERVAPALDDWAAVRRWAHGRPAPRADALNSLAADLDPDPLRVRLREALIAGDVGAVIAVSQEPGVDDLPSSTLCVLGSSLSDLGEYERSFELLERSVARHPGDLRLLIAAGTSAYNAHHWDIALQHKNAAAALRPELRSLQFTVLSLLRRTSRLPEAIFGWDQVLEQTPDDVRARTELAACVMELGDWPRAQRELELLERVNPAAHDRAAELAVARLRAGASDAAAFETRISELARSSAYAKGLWAGVLADGEPSAADLEHARALLAGASLEEWWSLKCGLALAQGRPQEALELLDDVERKSPVCVPPAQEIAWSALRSRALGALGEREEARAWLAQAERALAALVASAPQAWEHSPTRAEVVRARAELGE